MNCRVLVYELWADKEKLLDGRDLYSTVASYFELVFVFQLVYPKEAQTVITTLTSSLEPTFNFHCGRKPVR